MPEKPHGYPAAAYACLLPLIQTVGRRFGYAVAAHGSMNRDFDLIACPWTEEAADASTLVEAIAKEVGGYLHFDDPITKPHGRLAWIVYFTTGNAFLDISVMPRL